MNNLPKVVAQQRRGRASNPRLLDRKSDALPLSHRATHDDDDDDDAESCYHNFRRTRSSRKARCDGCDWTSERNTEHKNNDTDTEAL